jgi:hypothetical protein
LGSEARRPEGHGIMSENAERFVRFMRMVRIGSEPGSCWIFTGNCPGGRHGHFSIDYGTVKAHRWIYELVCCPIPEGLVLRHKCDVANCVNPAHLEPGSCADNTRDMYDRGRNPDRKGSNHPLSVLSEEQVRSIRRLASCGRTHHSIAGEFEISRQQVGKIVRRENWSHVQ